mgnify:CR=1 FL=1
MLRSVPASADAVIRAGSKLKRPAAARAHLSAIEAALEMPEDEQRHRMETMSAAVEAYTVRDWAEEQLAGFPEVSIVS